MHQGKRKVDRKGCSMRVTWIGERPWKKVWSSAKSDIYSCVIPPIWMGISELYTRVCTLIHTCASKAYFIDPRHQTHLRDQCTRFLCDYYQHQEPRKGVECCTGPQHCPHTMCTKLDRSGGMRDTYMLKICIKICMLAYVRGKRKK